MSSFPKIVTNSVFLYLLIVLCISVTPVRADGATEYLKNGYPTISIVGGTFLIGMAYYISVRSRKITGGVLNDTVWRENALFTVFLVSMYCCGVFLIFGPDTINAVENPRSAIIGLQLLFQVALGVYLMYHPSPMITNLYIVFGLFNLLALFGSNFLFNYNFAIWTLAQDSCNAYFNASTASSNTFQRCDDDGYLQFLRIMGHLVSLVLLTSIIYAIASAYENGQRLFSYGGQPTGVPAASVPAQSTTSYPNPSYPKEVGPSTAQATSVPVNY